MLKNWLGQRRFLNLAAADAGSADTQALARALYYRMNRMQIQVPTTLGHIMRMTDPMPELRPTATNFTRFCHKTHVRASVAGRNFYFNTVDGAGEALPERPASNFAWNTGS